MRRLVIRAFRAGDVPALEAILRANGQLWHQEVEGGPAMLRFAAHPGAVFLVCEARERGDTEEEEPRDAASAGRPVLGCCRGVYDGSRAVIHLLSVHPEAQGRGVGTALCRAMQRELKALGAPTVSATVGESSAGFWEKMGFCDVGVKVYLGE